jgi:hypothetical protein
MSRDERRRSIRQRAMELFDKDPKQLTVPATVEQRAAVDCWCGAPAGMACVDARGNPAPAQHHTRGMDPKVVRALAESAGLPWPERH